MEGMVFFVAMWLVFEGHWGKAALLVLALL
jgi:hypothetical protein